MGKYDSTSRYSILMSASVALCSIFPLTAILHHAYFYPPTCILNNFGHDYTLDVVTVWLQSDPSLYLGAIGALAIFGLAAYLPTFRLAALAFVIATIPLSIWIWDIPFTGRIICHLGHDGRWPVRTLYLYAVAAILFPVIFYWLRRRSAVAKVHKA